MQTLQTLQCKDLNNFSSIFTALADDLLVWQTGNRAMFLVCVDCNCHVFWLIPEVFGG